MSSDFLHNSKVRTFTFNGTRQGRGVKSISGGKGEEYIRGRVKGRKMVGGGKVKGRERRW